MPPSLLSADPRRVREFIGAGRAVVKPMCGTRATTQEIRPTDLDRLARSEGPVLVQRMIEGDHVRVHVVGEAVITCRFSSTTVDYRSHREATREVLDIPADLAMKLRRLETGVWRTATLC